MKAPLAPQAIFALLDEVARLTLIELTELVKSGGFLVCKDVYWAIEPSSLPKLHEGWQLTSTAPQDIRAARKIFITPTTPRTRGIWVQGLVNIAIRAGLEIKNARAWARSNIKEKHELLPFLAATLRDQKQVNGYLKIQPQMKWTTVNRLVNQHQLKHDFRPRFRIAMSNLVRELVMGVRAPR